MKKVVFASLLAVASSAVYLPPAAVAQQGSQSSQITIKDPAEYNAYTSAIGQSTPAAKSSAIESFLQQYPNSVVKAEMLEQLVGAYQAMGDTAKTYDAAKRLLQVDPNNLRALIFVVYVEKQQANGDQAKLDEAAALAQRGQNATKPANMSDADFQKLKDVGAPIFGDVIGTDDLAKKDYKDAISTYEAELHAAKDPAQTTQGLMLADTYALGNAFVQEDPKDLVNGIWYLTRAAQYLQEPYKTNVEKAAEYWYKKYHGSMDGFDQIKQMAHDNVFPPDSYKPVPAPPPPSPQQLAHNAVASTTDLDKGLSLADKEFVLANGTPDDAGKVWAVLQGKTTEVPGTVISATPDSVQLAVSDDAKQSQKADFTINMKTPLKEVPAPGTQVTYIATFDSYTQTPPMIVLKDGEPKPAAKAPVHHTTHRPSGKAK
ncbi:MAG TPA: hypothetical protein VE178_18220 [Silvibacterium sp.]|jgi:hypothetical protein|nr:hypothetical protein [Silvibacterium sp.]